jgi:hypothetical protein
MFLTVNFDVMDYSLVNCSQASSYLSPRKWTQSETKDNAMALAITHARYWSQGMVRHGL